MAITVDRPAAMKAAFVALATDGNGESTPILFGSNPVGDALVSAGIMGLSGAAAMTPVLPVRVAGIDVRQRMRRLDADPHSPSMERGVTAANRIGEALGRLTMQWLVAPDAFEAIACVLPPRTELDLARSQRFVMPDGVLRFEDRTESGARFFGAGRTYPVHGRGSHALFAGAAVVVEGLGSLKGLRGSLSIVGEISARSIVSMAVIGRFDDGPIEVAERLGMMIENAEGCAGATLLTLVGAAPARAADGHVDEALRITRIDNDLANAMQPRSRCRIGDLVGSATGPLRFDPSDHRCAVPLLEGRRELMFHDADGRTIATIEADGLEGTAFPDQTAGGGVSRVIAYGPLSGGNGALDNAHGILALDTSVSIDGASTTLYTLWLVDERRRFRARTSETGVTDDPPEHRATPDASPFADASAASMLPSDVETVSRAERTLADGLDLYRWFNEKGNTGAFRERFDVAREHGADDQSFGFFDVAAVRGAALPVMGVVQEMFYDRLKLGTPEPIREQLAEFVLRYFLRVCHVGEAEAVRPHPPAPDSAWQRAMSWLPPDGARGGRSGYEQVYYRLADSGRVGRFATAERGAIVDLRELGVRFSWVLLEGDVVSFELPFMPFGTAVPRTSGLKQPAGLVMSPAFVTNACDPAPGVLARYGFGWAFLPYNTGAQGTLAPGHFRTAVQTIEFRLMTDGEIRARTAFVVSRPDRIAAVDLDPIKWSVQLADLVTFRMASRLMTPVLAMADRLPLHAQDFDPVAAYIWMANTMTGGMAENYLGISKVAIEKRILFHHLKAHQELLHRSLRIWRMVPDWTAADALPDFCHGARS